MSDQGQWQVAGTAAEIYERALVPAVFSAWAPLVVDLADPRPGVRVLDVACGTGVIARLVVRRVGPTGEVVGIDLNPGFVVLAEALARRVSTEAAGIMRAPFGLAEAEELRRLIAAVGFGDITIRSVPGTVRFPSVERFVQDYVAGSPLAAHVAKVSDEARAALIREVGDTLKPYVAGGSLTFPIEAHLASAKK
jgi:SAM-dependent methyltransferase